MRSVRGTLLGRLPCATKYRPGEHGHLHGHGREPGRGAGAAGIFLRGERAVPDGGYGVLVLAGGGAPGGEQPARRRLHDGLCGRRQRHPAPADGGDVLAGGHALGGRPVQGVRRKRERVCTVGRRGHGAAETAGAGARRWRPGVGGDSRQRHQQRRSDQPHDDAQPHRPGNGIAGGLPGRGRGAGADRLCGSARNGHAGGRPDRDGGAGGGAGRRTRNGPGLPGRFQQDQRGAPGSGRGRGGADQDGAQLETPPDSREPELLQPEPEDSVGAAAPAGAARADPVAGDERAAGDGGGQLIRHFGEQRARGGGRSAAGKMAAGGGGPGATAGAFRAVRGIAGAQRARLPRADGQRADGVAGPVLQRWGATDAPRASPGRSGADARGTFRTTGGVPGGRDAARRGEGTESHRAAAAGIRFLRCGDAMGRHGAGTERAGADIPRSPGALRPDFPQAGGVVRTGAD